LHNLLRMLRRLINHRYPVIEIGSRSVLSKCFSLRGLSSLSSSFYKVLGNSSTVENSNLMFSQGGMMGNLAEASSVCSQGRSKAYYLDFISCYSLPCSICFLVSFTFSLSLTLSFSFFLSLALALSLSLSLSRWIGCACYCMLLSQHGPTR
jgi:hypothetical protein